MKKIYENLKKFLKKLNNFIVKVNILLNKIFYKNLYKIFQYPWPLIFSFPNYYLLLNPLNYYK